MSSRILPITDNHCITFSAKQPLCFYWFTLSWCPFISTTVLWYFLCSIPGQRQQVMAVRMTARCASCLFQVMFYSSSQLHWVHTNSCRGTGFNWFGSVLFLARSTWALSRPFPAFPSACVCLDSIINTVINLPLKVKTVINHAVL